ncbi:protein kinase domain-containing protein [Plantactinospora sp. WMMC1484]|uniref:protein kinase domain-containing protein n=1 Tax=Plantactinospora sp. WMMC1484 TaxID=3404122 RepID=UPI003BF5FB9C
MTGWGRWGGAERHAAELVGDRYRLIEELGEGGMSVVWRGHDEVLGRPVAVKMLAPRLTADRSFRHRLRAEARAAARLCHPHITGVYDYGESVRYGRTVPYVVMELVDGESLANRLDRDGPLPWWDAVVLGAQVAAALATAHARGVVHRDITPGNVMLTPIGAKVVDFGISALVGERDGDVEGGLFGTPAYVAPERLNRGEVCPATDVYALGLLLYRALSGRMPWRVSTRSQVLRAHLHAEPAPLPPVPGLPGEVVEVIDRCLAKAPQDRPESAELAQMLASSAGVVLPVAAGSGPVPRPGRPDLHAGGSDDTSPGGRPAPPLRSETAILPRSMVATDPALPGRRRWSDSRLRNPVRVAAVGIGLIAMGGAVWAGSGDGSPPAGGATTTTMAMGGSAPCRVDYVLRADDGRSFQADLTITNLGARAVPDWTLRFEFPGEQVLTRDEKVLTRDEKVLPRQPSPESRQPSPESRQPSPESRQQGRDVLIRPADGAETALPAGSAVQLTLIGNHPGSNPLPVDFTLGDTACAVRVSGVPGDSGGTAAGATTGSLPPAKSGNPPPANSSADHSGTAPRPGPKGKGSHPEKEETQRSAPDRSHPEKRKGDGRKPDDR